MAGHPSSFFNQTPINHGPFFPYGAPAPADDLIEVDIGSVLQFFPEPNRPARAPRRHVTVTRHIAAHHQAPAPTVVTASPARDPVPDYSQIISDYSPIPSSPPPPFNACTSPPAYLDPPLLHFPPAYRTLPTSTLTSLALSGTGRPATTSTASDDDSIMEPPRWARIRHFGARIEGVPITLEAQRQTRARRLGGWTAEPRLRRWRCRRLAQKRRASARRRSGDRVRGAEMAAA